MLKTIMLAIAIAFCSVDTADAGRYGRSDATHSHAYHGRHYNYTAPYYPEVVVRRSLQSRARCYNYVVPVPAPSYTPLNYYGDPYGAYRGYQGPFIQFHWYRVR